MISRHRGRNRGGVSVAVRRLAGGMVEQGARVQALVGWNAEVGGGGFAPEVVVQRLHRLHRWPVLWALYRRLRQQPPRALLAFDTRAAGIAAAATALPGARCPLWICPSNALGAQMASWSSSRRRRHVRRLRRVHQRAAGVIPVSRGLAADYIETLGVDAAKVWPVPNPVVDDHLLRQAQAPCEEIPGAGDGPLLVAMGRLSRQKDYPTLLRAFATLRRRRPARLLVLGEGEDRPALEALARELGIAGQVHFLGHRDNPFPLLARAAVFVLSSRWEGFGNVLAEAMALGVPVVSTDCPSGPAEILDGGRFGRLVPPGDPQALAEAVAATLDDPVPAARLRQAAERFRVSTVSRRYLEIMGLLPSDA